MAVGVRRNAPWADLANPQPRRGADAQGGAEGAALPASLHVDRARSAPTDPGSLARLQTRRDVLFHRPDRAGEEPAGKLEISDGQQRLATLTMMLAYVRDRLPQPRQAISGPSDHEGGDSPRLHAARRRCELLRGYVQEPGQMAELAEHAEIGIDSKDLLCERRAHDRSRAWRRSRRPRTRRVHVLSSRAACTLNVVDADERGCARDRVTTR